MKRSNSGLSVFATKVEKDNEEVERVQAWPLWEQLERDGHRYRAMDAERAHDRRGWVDDPITGYELLPENEHDAIFCMRVAKGDAKEFEKLYSQTSAGTVYRLYALQVASEYSETLSDENSPDERFYD